MSAGRAPELSVVIPIYDEEGSLARYPAELLPAIDRLGLAWQLVLVDDGSRDRSLAVARALAARHPDAVVVAHGENRGLGAAVRSGIAAATGELVLTLDADLTFAPDQAQALLARYRVGDVDAVLGSPSLHGYHGLPWHRVALSAGGNLLYQVALGRRLTAITPIFRLYRAAALRGLELASERFEINAEILAKLLLAGARVAEVPARLTTRTEGVSKLDNRAEIVNHLRLVWRVAGWRLGRRR